jgi:transcriptional regulator with XRE-family HTH domain
MHGLGFKIKTWREYRKLSRKEFAALVGITVETVSMLEWNATNPRRATLRKLEQATGLELIDNEQS